VSPDGKWMAYASNETGRYEVWIEPLPRPSTIAQGVRSIVEGRGGARPAAASSSCSFR
jgi:hypothetical protein